MVIISSWLRHVVDSAFVPATLASGKRIVHSPGTTRPTHATVFRHAAADDDDDTKPVSDQSSPPFNKNNHQTTNWLTSWWDGQQPSGVRRTRIQTMMQASKTRTNFVVVVTGATGGIGQAICRAILHLGGLVVAVDRDERALQELVVTLQREQRDDNDDNDTADRIRTVVADFTDLESVAQAGREIVSQVGTIDLLVNNAGIFYNLLQDGDEDALTPSKQGYDRCFAINYLSHFLLTEILRPKLNPLGARVVSVASGLHWGVDGSRLVPSSRKENTRREPAASLGKNQWEGHISTAYGNSKLAQLWHSAYLNRNYGPNVTAVCACPSWASTGIAGEDTSGQQFLETFAFPTRTQNNEELAGPALSSILNAMFVPTQDLDPAVLESRAMMGNARVMEDLFGSKPLTQPLAFLDSDFINQQMGGRAIFCQNYARTVVLFLQRWFHDELIVQPTSYEAGHNIAIQDDLCQWSLEAVKEWLPTASLDDDDDDEQEQEVIVV